ncbi:MAG: 3-dehydroquinate synthase [Deltaproteobacteria bacterium HGW-Deltaproteobacteria-15]|nr:MAG: 3-dehydroquinate synthase [Deltaproteobacteria bacterium HGW-Deltaproteobacteria-15]
MRWSAVSETGKVLSADGRYPDTGKGDEIRRHDGSMNRMKVNLDKRSVQSYEIVIGRDFMDRAGIMLAQGGWASKYFIIADSNVSALHGRRIQEQFSAMDIEIDMITFPAGEGSKNIQTILGIMDGLLASGADRSSGLIGLGGGVTGDITGFAASLFMRGLPYILVPTSLLAQVDSSIGGKTAVDLPAGKNLIGTFYQPRMVLIDLSLLETLPEKEFANGVAEVLKYGVIDDLELLDLLETGKEKLLQKDPEFLEILVTRSCRIKKGIVEIDEMEKGIRRFLNFGHTLGHAVEAESGYAMAHGEAVAIGMIAAAMLSERMNYLTASEARRIEFMVKTLGLPHRIPGELSVDSILSRLKVDKKKTGHKINFVLLKSLGVPFVNGGVPQELVREVMEELRR